MNARPNKSARPLWLIVAAIALAGAAAVVLLRRYGATATDVPAPATPAAYTAQPAAPAVAVPLPVFEDVTAAAGIDFKAMTGADGHKLMPETMGAGLGIADLDGDGWLDLIMVNGRSWDGKVCPPLVTVYRNLQNGKFRDVTAELGLKNLCGYGMGVAVADYDGDGRADIFVTSLDGNHLLRNDGGRFTDATKAAGLASGRTGVQDWSTSAVWVDVDGDGLLDLFVANYVRWTPQTDVFTTRDGVNKSYATPTVYQGLSNRLYRNKGGGRFEDVTRQAGLYDEQNKALAVVVLDVNGDARPDLFVSNDTLPNKLYVNDGRGRFEDRSLEYGVGYDETGRAKAGMGTDAVEIGGGTLAIGVGNFSDEATSHYEMAPGVATFVDASPRRGLASATLADLTFGTRFADLNNDGLQDLVIVNGHIEPSIAKVQATTSYEQQPRLFLGDPSGRYLEYSRAAGKPLASPMVGRALAVGDIFNTGKLDLLISTNGGAPRLLRNVGPERGYVQMTLVGKGTNRDALGSTVELQAANGWRWRDSVRARPSYLASSPYTLHTGVPDGVTHVDLKVTWPDGSRTIWQNVPANSRYRLTQGGDLNDLNVIKKRGNSND